MKKFLLIILICVVSCSNQNSEEDGDLLNDKDNDIAETEEIQDDDFYSPACLDDWEEIEPVEDVKELFDFKIIEKMGKLKWDQLDDGESLDFEGNPERVLGVMKDGSLVLSEFSEIEGGYSLLVILHSDGTYKRYVFGIDAEKEINYGMGEGLGAGSFNLWSGYGFDEKNDEIYISVTARSKMQTSVEGEYFARPFLVKIDSEGNLSYKTWKYAGNSVCINIINRDDKIFLSCQHWSSDPEIYQATGGMNAEINVIDGNRVFRKLLYTDFFAISNFMVSEEEGKIYTSYSEYDSGVDPIPDFIYSIDECDLCLETFREDDFINENAFKGTPPGGDDLFHAQSFLKNGDYFILGGLRQKWIYEETHSFLNNYTSLYFDGPEKDALFSFGMEDPFLTVGEEDKMHSSYLINLYPKKDSNMIFAALITTFDIEDKGRDWITEEVMEQTKWPFLPAIVAVDLDNNEVYAKQFFVDVITGNNGMVFYVGNYIYLLMTFAQEDGDDIIYNRELYRLPEEWLINEDAKAKDTRLWIEEF